MSSASVQFRGFDQVLKAYEMKGIGTWSMWQGKSMLHKCECSDVSEGLEELRQWLQMLGTSSNAIYTLCVYEEPTKGKINSSTPNDGSFNFRLNMEEQTVTNFQYYASVQALQKEIEDLKLKLAGTDEEDDDDDDEEDTFDKIERIMGLPVVSAAIGKIFGFEFESKQLGKVAGVHNDSQLNEAIQILKQHDPALSSHLWKLAQMATTNPSGFKFLLSTLDSMK